MNFENQLTKNQLNKPKIRPFSSCKTNQKRSLLQQTTLYNYNNTPQLFYTSVRRPSCRPQRAFNNILSLGDARIITSPHRNSFSISRKSVSKKIQQSYYMETKDNYLAKYILKEQLGKGSFGVVYFAEDRITGQKLAVKVYEKFKINHDPAKFKNIRREISILQSLDHPHIVKLIKNIESLTKISLTLEYCGKDSLYELVNLRFPLEQSMTRRLLHQVLQAISYLHSKNIVHRDIKAQNLLITEFWIFNSQYFDDYSANKTRKLSSICGTPNYMAPQLLKKQEYVGQYADMWSFGILVYYLVQKRYPFRAQSLKQLSRVVQQCKIQFRKCQDKFLQSVVRRCLRLNPLQRISASRLMEQNWSLEK